MILRIFSPLYFRLSYLYFFLCRKSNCSHAKSMYKVGKGTLIILSTKRNCRLWREVNSSPAFCSAQAASSPSSDRKITGLKRSKRTSERSIPGRKWIKNNTTTDRRFFESENYAKNNSTVTYGQIKVNASINSVFLVRVREEGIMIHWTSFDVKPGEN